MGKWKNWKKKKRKKKKEEEEEEEEEEEGKCQRRKRASERDSPVRALRAKFFAIVQGTWWCGESTSKP